MALGISPHRLRGGKHRHGRRGSFYPTSGLCTTSWNPSTARWTTSHSSTWPCCWRWRTDRHKGDREASNVLWKGRGLAALGICGSRLRIRFEEAPRYSSQSLGHMGAFQKLLRGDVLTQRYAIEAEYGMTLHASHNLWPWLVRWCSFLRSRFVVKANQRTAYQDTFDCA